MKDRTAPSEFAKPFPKPEPFAPRGHVEILRDLAVVLSRPGNGNDMEAWQHIGNLAYEAEKWLDARGEPAEQPNGDEDQRQAAAEARRRELPEIIRHLMYRDVHLNAILKAWICSGMVPVDLREWLKAEPGKECGDGVQWKPGTYHDVVEMALAGMVTNKAALMAAFTNRMANCTCSAGRAQ